MIIAVASPAALAPAVTVKGDEEVEVVAIVVAGAAVIGEAGLDLDQANLHMIVDEGRSTNTGTDTKGSTEVVAVVVIERRSITNIEKVTNIIVTGANIRTKNIMTGLTAESTKNVIDNQSISQYPNYLHLSTKLIGYRNDTIIFLSCTFNRDWHTHHHSFVFSQSRPCNDIHLTRYTIYFDSCVLEILSVW